MLHNERKNETIMIDFMTLLPDTTQILEIKDLQRLITNESNQ